MYRNTCKKCNYKWESNRADLVCPNCKSTGGGVIGYAYIQDEPVDTVTVKQTEVGASSNLSLSDEAKEHSEPEPAPELGVKANTEPNKGSDISS